MSESSGEIPQIIKSRCFNDARGAFYKLFEDSEPLLQGFQIKQINFVENPLAGVLRGLHYQEGEYAEAKLFRVLEGKAQIVWLDVRAISSTYLSTGSVVLTEPEQALLVPRGFATGYAVLADNTKVLYLSDNIYSPTAEKGMSWNDPALTIEWLVKSPIVSEKDEKWPILRS